MKISSVKNPKIQWIRGLQTKSKNRRVEKAFVIEGVRLVEEALNSGWLVNQVFHADDLNERGRALINEFESRGGEVYLVSPHVMRAISELKTSQGILAVLELQSKPIPAESDFVLILDQLRDPGNLGAILRSAASAGVDGVLLSPGSVDPFSPKVLRAGMGAHFRLSIQICGWDEISSQIDNLGLRTHLASIIHGKPYYQVDLIEPIALIIGSESEGASETAQQVADSSLHIPMPGGGDSLNAAVAAGILLFEVVRQRGMSS